MKHERIEAPATNMSLGDGVFVWFKQDENGGLVEMILTADEMKAALIDAGYLKSSRELQGDELDQVFGGRDREELR